MNAWDVLAIVGVVWICLFVLGVVWALLSPSASADPRCVHRTARGVRCLLGANHDGEHYPADRMME